MTVAITTVVIVVCQNHIMNEFTVFKPVENESSLLCQSNIK